MDPRLLRYYNQELRYLRELGGEFAREFPKIAGRLGMEGMEVADPYVERLLEGCAFLAARVQLKQDAEFPQLAQRLIEMISPNLAAPIPSMLVARIVPANDPNLINGFRIARGSALIGPETAMSRTRCEFRTAHEVVLTPIRVAGAEYFLSAADLGLANLPLPERPRSGVRLKLELPAGMAFSQLKLGTLRFFIGGLPDVALRLHELIVGSSVGVLAGAAGRGADAGRQFLAASQVRAAGFGDEEAMLPVTLRGLAGTRLMQEYFAFAQRFLFIDIGGLGAAFAKTAGNTFEIVILFNRYVAPLEGAVEPENFQLHCVPAINLFERRADRLHLDEGATAYHLVPERTASLDYEVFDILSVRGFHDDTEEQTFLPLFAAPQAEPGAERAYYSSVREPRLPSDRGKREGPRSGYVGTETFLSLVDSREQPYRGALRQLAVQVRCTNRDLPLFLPTGQAQGELILNASAPIEAIHITAGPSRPQSAMKEGGIAWRLLGLLSLNYLSLLESDPESGALTLREILTLFASGADVGLKRQIEGVRSVSVKPIVRRHPVAGPIAFSRGLEVRVTVDDLSFEGGSAVLLLSVLHQYFSRHVSMNSFVQTVLASMTRGDVMTWAPRLGARALL
ncbi:MAG: type VI secretion system baseplate subunit TssF [Caldimonas sp.]